MISEITLKFIQMHLSKATGEVMRVISCKIIHNFTGNVRAIQKIICLFQICVGPIGLTVIK